KKVSPEELIKNTLAITAKPTRFYNLTNRTIKEAENLLFGDIAEKFFKKNYPPEIFAAEKYAEKMSLCDAVVAEKKLRDTIVETEIAIKILENEAALASASIVRPWQTIQRVKVRVGECYALRYELESLRSVHEKFSEEHAALAKILDELRAAVNRIKKLHIAEPPDEISECDMLARAEKLAPVAISLIRDDGLLRENHIVRNTRGESCLLRVVGGFAPCDLQKKF
ncbi:MAG: hypothetical protein FWF80_00195, partial [Defluviitaleaceae bacterium]|nr:hypothetical protein [Defluviitaleaceae bacterium]